MSKRMADSVTPANLPAGFDAYLGYVDGAYANLAAIKARFPGVPVYGLSVVANPNLGPGDDGSDSEPGDSTIAEAVADTKAQLAAGVDRPIKYCPASWGQTMVDAHDSAEITRDRYRLLLAHYGWPGGPNGEHICGPATCGYVQADGTQWIDHGPWDESLLDDTFITAAPHPGTAPTASHHGGNMLAFDPVTGGTWALRPDGSVYADDGAPYLGGLNNHPDYQAGAGKKFGPAVGIAAYGPGGKDGYEILTDNGTTPAPDRYRFPRDGSLAQPSATVHAD